MNHESLKQRQRRERHTHSGSLGLRVHRALSWLGRAEQMADDRDSQFILLWIAFNAAYATNIDERYRTSERSVFRSFLDRLIELDRDHAIETLVWTEFSGSIRLLLGNVYIFQDFWNFQAGKIGEAEWKQNFANAKRAAQRALSQRSTATVLSIVLSRLYTLRNQLMHGGATWNGSVNREQVRDAANLLAKLVPLIVRIMLDNPDSEWAVACYPVVR